MEISSSGRFQRLKAVCVITHGGEYLFPVGADPLDQRTFLVLVGGGISIEFGELALPAAVREVREEIGADVEAPRLLGFQKNILPTRERRTTRSCFVSSAGCGRRMECRRKGVKAMA